MFEGELGNERQYNWAWSHFKMAYKLYSDQETKVKMEKAKKLRDEREELERKWEELERKWDKEDCEYCDCEYCDRE